MTITVTEFPTQAQHETAWKKLAKLIAAQPSIHNSEKKGELIILGSGIETLGFVANDIPLIKTADVVFYCVADPGTVTWIKTIRPDAYDLYVLYGDDKLRYTTYMQMTEAMLYPVRQGQKVVAIYYGHPGIFALSPHRAVLIARREGHKALMRPGISALDCLCADLGIDPAHPGLQTYEATDMLLRRRVPDCHLHLVLWQVGLIGEMGFRHQGYLNQKFSLLLEYLQAYYTNDHSIVHYIASRYSTIPPVIEYYTLDLLADPKKQLKITGISTFYIPPHQTAPTDLVMLERLGLIKNKKKPFTLHQSGPLREIGHYGPRERKAFDALKQFTIPNSYHWQENTAASRFLIDLTQDKALQAKFSDEPLATVSQFPGLTTQEKRLLASRDTHHIQVAAKGLFNRSVKNDRFLIDVFFKKKLFSEIALIIQENKPLESSARFQTLQQTYSVDWRQLQMSLERMSRLSLGMWDGIYFCRDKDCLITLQADFFQQQGRLYINGQPIKKFNFANGLLEWSVQEGIDDCGCLRLDIDRYGQRCLMGSFYQPNKIEPADFFKFPELRLLKNSLYPLVGCYRQLIATTSYQYLEIKPVSYSPNLRKIAVLLDKVLQEAPIRYDPFHKTLFVGKNAFPLAINGRNAEGWSPVAGLGSWYEGSYKLSIKNSASVFHHLEIHSQKATLNQQILMINKIGLKNLTWNKSNAFFPEGKLSFYLNPINLLPYGLGVVKPASGSACICYGIAAEAEQTFATVDYHGLFDISDAAWHRLTQQCNRETIAKQDSLVFWVSFYRVAQSIKMLYWLAKQMSV